MRRFMTALGLALLPLVLPLLAFVAPVPMGFLAGLATGAALFGWVRAVRRATAARDRRVAEAWEAWTPGHHAPPPPRLGGPLR